MSGCIIWGGTGQAKIVRPIIENHGLEVLAIFDDTEGLTPPFNDIPLYFGNDYDSWISQVDKRDLKFCVAIGNPSGLVRIRIANRLTSDGLTPIDAVHKTAFISNSAVIGSGCQISAGATVLEEAVLGIQCIVNTNASVDHECVLGNGVEISPGVTLCGNVTIDDGAWIGAGATVLPGLQIGENSIVGAGALVVEDVPPNVVVVGVPSRITNRK